MVPIDSVAPERRRLSIRLPHPVWIALGTAALAVVILGLSVCTSIYRTQILIREIEQLGGKCSTKRTLPDWLRDRVGDDVARRFEPVRTVFFQDVSLPEEKLQLVARFGRVERLWLHGVGLTDTAFTHLRQLESLSEIELVNMPITGEGFGQLRDLPHLEKVWIMGCPISDAGLAELARLVSLREISLYSGDANS